MEILARTALIWSFQVKMRTKRDGKEISEQQQSSNTIVGMLNKLTPPFNFIFYYKQIFVGNEKEKNYWAATAQSNAQKQFQQNEMIMVNGGELQPSGNTAAAAAAALHHYILY